MLQGAAVTFTGADVDTASATAADGSGTWGDAPSSSSVCTTWNWLWSTAVCSSVSPSELRSSSMRRGRRVLLRSVSSSDLTSAASPSAMARCSGKAAARV